MLKRMLVTCAVLALAGVPAVAALDQEAIERADTLYEDDRSADAVAVLEEVLSTARTGAERAEVYWRLSRATLSVGEDLEDDGADNETLLAVYEDGEEYGVQAVEADPSNHLGYYWQSANIGKWGQTKGILDSLFRAGPMRDLLKQAIQREPDHAGSYYVLGQLYAQVPGFISFGNVNYAVSLARKSVDLHEAELTTGEEDDVQHDYYIQLASHLKQRNWNAGRRAREQQNKERAHARTDDVLERGWHYEGTVDIPDMSDRDEAERILRDVIRRLEAITERTEGQEGELEEARELLQGL
jgi:tetratricopeptide (TPR) repeat protein